MKRIVRRSKNLPAFQVDLPALKRFADAVSDAFGNAKPDVKIEFTLKGDEIQFGNINELESHAAELPGVVTNFEISWWDFKNDRHCNLGSTILSASKVRAEAPDEAWCAGVIAVAEKHARANRRWYGFLREWHFLLCAIVLAFIPWIILRIAGKVDLWTMVSWVLVVVLMWTLAFGFNRVFPTRSLLIRKNENFFRRYATELTLLLAILSLVVALVALFR